MLAALLNWFRGKPAPMAVPPPYIVAHLAARVHPAKRAEIFEYPLDARLTRLHLGHVMGGSTLMAPDPVGIASCDIEISLPSVTPEAISLIITALEELGAPKGSTLHIPEQRLIAFGQWEGMAIFLNGTDLPSETYLHSDINQTIDRLNTVLSGAGEFRGHWEGAQETALYFYGPSFAAMAELARYYLHSDALCAQCRIEQIA